MSEPQPPHSHPIEPFPIEPTDGAVPTPADGVQDVDQEPRYEGDDADDG